MRSTASIRACVLMVLAVSSTPTAMVSWSGGLPPRRAGEPRRALSRRLRGGDGGDSIVEAQWRAVLVERRQAAWSGLKAALQDSFCQMDPTVSSYICDVLANAGDGEERDAGSLIPSLPAILSAHAVRARVRARDTEKEDLMRIVEDVLALVRNTSTGSFATSSISMHLGAEQRSFGLAPLLHWKEGGGPRSSARSAGGIGIRLGVLLDEQAEREARRAECERTKRRMGNTNVDVDRAWEADQRKEERNIPCNTAGWAAPPVVSHTKKQAAGAGGGKDITVDGIDLSYGGNVSAGMLIADQVHACLSCCPRPSLSTSFSDSVWPVAGLSGFSGLIDCGVRRRCCWTAPVCMWPSDGGTASSVAMESARAHCYELFSAAICLCLKRFRLSMWSSTSVM